MAKLVPCPKCESLDVYSNSLPGGIRTECDGCGYKGFIEGGAAVLQITQDFWSAIHQILWLGYVTCD